MSLPGLPGQSGWHLKAGQPHAEILALRQAGESAKGATIYINLEPCCHKGRTPPCTDSIINAGVKKAVVSMKDLNPKVNGMGIERLRAAGIDVELGIMSNSSLSLNEGFVHRMKFNRPFVRLKTAASIDGKTALSSGESQWISGERSRQDVHHWRAQSSAIITGSGTVLADNPELTVRHVKTERQPLRVIVDSKFSTPLNAKILHGPGNVLVVTANKDVSAQTSDIKALDVINLPNANKQVNLGELMHELSKREINELMVEAGPTLSGALLEKGLVDELLIYMAPTVLGDKARGMFVLPQPKTLKESLKFKVRDICQLDNDIRVRLRVND